MTWYSLFLEFFLSFSTCYFVYVIFLPSMSSPREYEAPLMIEHLS